jgi:hypothetical protein
VTRVFCISLAALVAATSAASACKCGVSSRESTIESTPVVFEGRITGIQTRGTAQVTTFSVVRTIKGQVGATVRVTSSTVSSACGYDFREAAKTLTVGGSGSGRSISVRRCTMFNLNP